MTMLLGWIGIGVQFGFGEGVGLAIASPIVVVSVWACVRLIRWIEDPYGDKGRR
jgi:uncharacterized membrane-anchored protein